MSSGELRLARTDRVRGITQEQTGYKESTGRWLDLDEGTSAVILRVRRALVTRKSQNRVLGI